MVKRIAVHVVSFCLLTACAAGKAQAKGLKSTPGQPQPKDARQSLPDAPSAVLLNHSDRLQNIGFEPLSPFLPKDSLVGANADFVPGTGLGPAVVGPPPPLLDLDKAIPTPKESSPFFEKYLYPALSKENLRYYPSSRDSFMGRATDAASRIFVVRDESGRQRLNTSYFLGVLTSVAIATAYRPYWARSTSGAFNNFGTTIGGDAGINVLHEFGPGVRQMVNAHTPRFVSRIEERISHDQFPREVEARIPAGR